MAPRIALTCLVVFIAALVPPGVRAQQPDPATPFLGTWCAQGDRTKHTSITSNGVYLTLTNESGSTSIGHVSGGANPQITADEWNFVQGSLSADGRTINWTNGTFWSRCASHRPVDLQGTWYAGGDHSKACYIDQRGDRLMFRNEVGQSATGSFTGRYAITTDWSGVTISGTISRTQNRILWSNGTYWTR